MNGLRRVNVAAFGAVSKWRNSESPAILWIVESPATRKPDNPAIAEYLKDSFGKLRTRIWVSYNFGSSMHSKERMQTSVISLLRQLEDQSEAKCRFDYSAVNYEQLLKTLQQMLSSLQLPVICVIQNVVYTKDSNRETKSFIDVLRASLPVHRLKILFTTTKKPEIVPSSLESYVLAHPQGSKQMLNHLKPWRLPSLSATSIKTTLSASQLELPSSPAQESVSAHQTLEPQAQSRTKSNSVIGNRNAEDELNSAHSYGGRMLDDGTGLLEKYVAYLTLVITILTGNRDEDSKKWMQHLNGSLGRLGITSATEPVKIAILDTGVQGSHELILANKRRIKESLSFLTDDESTEDMDGHGTHVAGLLLRVAKVSDIYIGRVAKSNQLESPESVAKVFVPDCH
jgi:hypothetical protein